MNDQRPTDPREQMEVRITALLLGEASAFEEAELLDAIKQDPQFAAYYEEMRRMVKQVEAAVQSAPLETVAERPRLADERRAHLEALFKQPAARTIRSKPRKERVRRSGWIPNLAEIAAIVAILCVLAGLLFPAHSSAKFKSRSVRLEAERKRSIGGAEQLSTPDRPLYQTNVAVAESAISVTPEGERSSLEAANGVVAVTLDSHATSFSVPMAGNHAMPKLSPSPVSPPPQPMPALGPAKLEDSVEMKPVIIVGSTLPSIQSNQAADRTVEEVDRLGAVRGKADNSQRGLARRDALSVEAKDGAQMNGFALAPTVAAGGSRGEGGGFGGGAAKPNADRYYFAQAGETAAAGVPINQPAPAADNLLTGQDLARTSSESVVQLPPNQLALGRKNLSEQAGARGGGGGGIRFLTATNDMRGVNTAMLDYLKKEAGVELAAPSMMYYNDRTGMLMVKAPLEQLELVQQAVEKINRQPNPASAPVTALSRFDALSDVDLGDLPAEGLLGETRSKRLADISKGDVADTIAPVEQALVEKVVEDSVEAKLAPPPPSLEPLPEISTKDNAFSTFSLNVSDVSFQLAASSLENGQMPDGARLRSEEFINAFDYRDPMPAPGQRVAFNWERARNPFAHNRELLRFSVQTAAAGRAPGQPLNLVLLLDNSGSMERADRVQITEQMLRVLAAQLTGYDRISFISFARTPRLIVDGATGGNPDALLQQVIGLNPDGGTNLEDAMKLAYETAAKHFQANGNNRVILITDGAANLGNVDPQQLRERVIEQRKKGIALDCFGVGWEGFNDNLLESLSRNGDGRYGFLNDANNAPAQFASQLAGALQAAASDVKAQIEFNPNRVTVYRQIGYQQHQLTKEQFRDNTVDAAEIGAAEAGNALYSIEVNPNGSGPIGTFRVRYRVPSTGLYEEKEWVLPFAPNAAELEKAAPAMRLASTAAAFAEWLANSPYAQAVTPDVLQNLLRGVPEVYSPDPRPAKLQTMIQQARAISGR